MPRRVLLFFPHNLLPPRSGAHLRAREMLGGLRALGCEITFASSTLSSETAWTTSDMRELGEEFSIQIEVYQASQVDWRFVNRLRRVYSRLRLEVPVNSRIHTPPGMRDWFRQLFARKEPDIVMLNYAYWDGLVSRQMHQQAATVIDTHDLITLHERMRQAVEAHLPPAPIRAAQVNPAILDETFFERQGLDATPLEYRILDHYAQAIAIAPNELERIAAHTRHVRVVRIPMTYPAQPAKTDYSGAAIFPTGPNTLNLQGYLYFAGRVLPLVRPMAPDFALHVSGAVCAMIEAEPGIVLRGFVARLASLYETAAFVACPVLGKTGQQVKIVEAMAYGLPVVATQAAAEGSPLQHGQTGFIAHNAAEFAEYSARLWGDRPLCRVMGRQAQAVIASDYSQDQLARWLAPLVDPTAARTAVGQPIGVPAGQT